MSIIVVGSGLSGAILSLAISYFTSGKLAVHLIEAIDPRVMEHPGFDSRAIVLAQGTCQQLKYINIWKKIAYCATPIYSVHISDRGHVGFVTLEAQDYCIDALGQVVELHEVGMCLFNLLQMTPGVTLHCPTRVVSITRNDKKADVTLDDGKKISGQLLVVADGSRSMLAAQCGIIHQQQTYNQAAVIANVVTAVAHDCRAWERFTEYGPLAILPMSHGRCSLVWCHALDHINEVISWSDGRFCTELQRAFGWRLGRITYVGNRTIYPLKLISATRFISHRVVLVGNAAQTLHPIAGQGFNLGLRDVMSLAEVISQAWYKHQDYGEYSILNNYKKRRQIDKETTIGITDGLVRLFANRCIPLVIGRNVGLTAMELFAPLRDILTRHTLGFGSTLGNK